MNRKSWVPMGLALASLLASSALGQGESKPAAPQVTVTPFPPAATQAPVAAPPVDPAKAPKLVMEETTYNGGEVNQGDSITHDFVVKNTGKGDLLILEVKPACGCTAPDWTKVVAAGGTGKITLKVDTARFKGPISKTATVKTNDPEQPEIRLVVNGDVKTFIDVLPRDVVTFRQYRGEEQKQELTVHSNESGEFKVNEVKVTGDGIKHELAKGDGGDYKLTVWMDKAAPVGNASGQVKLLTNSPKQPEVNVEVRGTILGQVNVNPSTLYFRVDNTSKEVVALSGNLNVRERGELGSPVVAKVGKDEKLKVLEETDEWSKVELPSRAVGWVYKKMVGAAPAAETKQSKVLNVTHREAGSFKITGTSVEGQQLDTKAIDVDTVQEGQSYRLTVSYAGGLTKGNYTGTLVVRTNDATEPEVRVPLYIVVS